MTTHHKITLDREEEQTVNLECDWTFHSSEPGSLAICAYWELERVRATDADSGQRVELDEAERLSIAEQMQPKLGRFER